MPKREWNIPIKIVHGFGRAGSSRSLRKTSTAAGFGHTATVDEMGRQNYNELPEPSVEDIWRSIETGQCCFCDSPKTYVHISQHWSRLDGVDLQQVRDKLQVPKHFPLISKEHSKTLSDRSKRTFPKVAKKLWAGRHKQKGQVRVFSEYGKAVNRAKLASIPENQKAVNSKKGGAVVAKKYRKSNKCIICGKAFMNYNGVERRHEVGGRQQLVGARKFKTCSTKCDSERRRRGWHERNPEGRESEKRYRNCPVCSKRFWHPTGRKSCSIECEGVMREQGYANRKKKPIA
jgi:hypothetical protein